MLEDAGIEARVRARATTVSVRRVAQGRFQVVLLGDGLGCGPDHRGRCEDSVQATCRPASVVANVIAAPPTRKRSASAPRYARSSASSSKGQ